LVAKLECENEHRGVERIRGTMGYMMNSNRMNSDQVKKVKVDISRLMKENRVLTTENSHLTTIISNYSKSNTELQTEMTQWQTQYNELTECMQLIGLDLQIIKHNFNNGIVYLVKPQRQKKIILLTLNIENITEKDEIMKMGKMHIFIYR
jgi:regulator of replication initiation timing